MRRLSFVSILASGFVAALAGCGSAVVQPDLAVNAPGCRAPELCLAVGCSCKRADVTSGSCVVCDPTVQTTDTQQCTCAPGDADGGAVCVEPAQLCVGRGTVCFGTGARCVSAQLIGDGGVCPSTGGDPPTMAPVDTGDGGGPESVPRCPYADDVCCGGSTDGGLDLSVPDLSSPPDLTGID